MHNRLNSLWALQTFQVRTILWNRITTSNWYLASLSKPYISSIVMAILSDVDGQISTLTKCYCTKTALYNHKIQFFQIAIRKSTHMWKKTVQNIRIWKTHTILITIGTLWLMFLLWRNPGNCVGGSSGHVGFQREEDWSRIKSFRPWIQDPTSSLTEQCLRFNGLAAIITFCHFIYK